MTRSANAGPEDPVVLEVPEACASLASERLPNTAVEWDRWMSFAGCTTPSTAIDPIVDGTAIWPAVDRAAIEARPTLMIYLHAIDRGPPIVQIRGLHRVGTTLVTMVVRLRAAIPSDRRAVHDKLEIVVAPALRAALTAFALVERVSDGMTASDPVTAQAIRESAQYVRLFRAFGIEAQAASTKLTASGDAR
jgi:hypothetical protein